MQSTPQHDKHKQIGHVLEAHERRLMSLQVSLQAGLRNGDVDQNQFEKRFQYLKRQLKEIKEISAWHSAEAVALTQESNLGLPDLEQCSPEERQVCINFLAKRQKLLEHMLKEVTKVYGWVVDASRGKGWSWLLIWRLSKLKRLLQRVDLQMNGLVFDNEEQDKLLQQIAKTLSRGDHTHVQDNLDALIKLFNNLDYAAAKVAHLKANLRREEETVTRMQNYLSHYEKVVMKDIKPTPPPRMATTKQLSEEIESSGDPQVTGTMRKLTLARSYVSDQLQQSEERFGKGRAK